MKREIKFRGKRIDNGEWIYGWLSGVYPDGRTFIMNKHFGTRLAQTVEVDPETVAQFTGQADMNGSEIYEGDKDKSGAVIMWNEEKSLFAPHVFYDILNKWGISSYPMDGSQIELLK